MENNAVLHIGNVESVRGRIVEIRVSKSKNSPHLLYNGQIIKGISVGNYVKICKGFEELIGKVDEEYITEDKLISQKEYKQGKAKIKRILRLSLIGYFENSSFKQGVKELPLIENEAFLLTEVEINKVHNFIKEIDGKLDDKLEIGVLSNETGTPIGIGINSLFASHIGIFGNTGSGKSYTLASLYHKLFYRYRNQSKFKENAKFLLIDFNGEYLKEDLKEDEVDKVIWDSDKSTYSLSTDSKKGKDKLKISHKTIYDETFWSILLQATEKTQMPFIASALHSNYLIGKLKSKEGLIDLIKSTIKLITVNITPNQEKNFVETFLDEISKFGLEDNIKGLNELKSFYAENLNFFADKKDRRYYCCIDNVTYNSNKDDGFFENVISNKVDEYIKIDFDKIKNNELMKIKLIFNFHYYYVIQKGYYQKEHIGHIIGRLNNRLKDLNKIITVSDDDFLNKTLTIVSLKNVNVQMRKLIPLIICHQVYKKKKEARNLETYLNLIIDEAHNILSTNSIRESETWKDYRLETFEEIIKEGRKFGVFLTIASQRPSDISDTIISQLHNYFLHRLINNRDIQAVERTISYLDKVSFDALPILPTGTCVLAGLSAQVPVIIKIDEITKGYEPFNKTIRPTDYWEDGNDIQNTQQTETYSQDAEITDNEEDDLPF